MRLGWAAFLGGFVAGSAGLGIAVWTALAINPRRSRDYISRNVQGAVLQQIRVQLPANLRGPVETINAVARVALGVGIEEIARMAGDGAANGVLDMLKVPKGGRE